MAVASFSRADAFRFVSKLPKRTQRLIRPIEVESVCKTALDLKKQYGILEAIPRTLQRLGLMSRSEKEQSAYRRLLLLLLLEWKRPKRQAPKAPPQPQAEGPLLILMRTPLPEKTEKTCAYKKDLFD